MALSSTIQSALSRHQEEIYAALQRAMPEVSDSATQTTGASLAPFYGQMQYHLGWVDTQFAPAPANPGKLLRPKLLLLAYEAAGAWGLVSNDNADTTYLRRALPAAAAIELTHNFTLIHDDIEDHDIERRHRPTLWSLWGIPQALNTGDGMFALSRLTLWRVLQEGVAGDIAARLGAALDHACLTIAEGQYLDISFEEQQTIAVAAYIDMIGRKTGALMECAAQMGALLGTHDAQTIERLTNFGHAIGIAFQVRDDLLGVWASNTETGKTEAGDVYRRKKSLPILHALEHANTADKDVLDTIYRQTTPVTLEQVEAALAIFERTHTRAYCRDFLAQHCHSAYEALAHIPLVDHPISIRALDDLKALVRFVEEATYS